jgi:hypothetical protein
MKLGAGDNTDRLKGQEGCRYAGFSGPDRQSPELQIN